MPITETMTKVVCNTVLSLGTDSEGKVKTLTQNIGSLYASRWDAEKAFAITDKLEACLAYPIYQVQAVKTNTLHNDPI